MQRIREDVAELLQEKPRHRQRQQENPNNFITCPRMIHVRKAMFLKLRVAGCGLQEEWRSLRLPALYFPLTAQFADRSQDV